MKSHEQFGLNMLRCLALLFQGIGGEEDPNELIGLCGQTVHYCVDWVRLAQDARKEHSILAVLVLWKTVSSAKNN